jgi:hypothetical protein
MNYIDRLFMNPIMDNNGNKILLIDNDLLIRNDLETLKRVCHILGEPVNMIRTEYVINKFYFINKIKKNPYI